MFLTKHVYKSNGTGEKFIKDEESLLIKESLPN